MTNIDYATARPVNVAEVEAGDQVLSPYGYRVVREVVPNADSDLVRFEFWDDASISRRAGSSIDTKKRLAA